MRIVRTLSICSFLLPFFTVAFALNPDRDIHQLGHRSWGEKDGYPGRTQALAQTTDGFLWIGSDVGLFRFDGVRFELYSPRYGDKLAESVVHSLLALSDGTLWVAYDGDNICDLRNGYARCYGKGDGVTSNPTAIVHDREGTIWANTETGVIRFNGRRWEHIGKEWNFPDEVPRVTSEALFVDSRGTLWAGVNHTVLYLKQGSRRFEPTGVFAGWSVSMAEAPDGTIWLADNDSVVRAIGTSVSSRSAAIAKCEVETPKGRPPRCPREDSPAVKIDVANDLVFDRNGSLWITTDTSGLGRVVHPERLRDWPTAKSDERIQRFTSKDGLTADNCTPILEDREGNIWVATRDGLDQFRDTALVPSPLPTSMIQIGIAPADGGDIWVAGSWSYVARIHGDWGDVSLTPADAFKPYRDPAGVTWLIGNSLAQWKDGRFQRVAASPDGRFGSLSAWQVAADEFGTLWAFSDGLGFFSLDHGRWRSWATPPEVAKQSVADMFSDSTGSIWVSTYEGDIIKMDKGKIVDYPVRPDSPVRFFTAFAERAPHEIWACGAGGLVLIDNGNFRFLRPSVVESFGEVTGVVDAGREGLWLNTTNGVIHISRDEADRALRDPSHRLQWERFDSYDGLPGQSRAISGDPYPYPTAIQGTDGRIWFTATRGVAWVDPRSIPRNALPPPVSITSVSADGSRYLRLADLRFPAHTGNLQIDYSALSLSVPERVRFRYKLDGVDKGWQEVDTRRQAYYSNVGPGTYQFRVIACNNDGVWNETGASVYFSIAPAYYQTLWFRLCLLAAFLLLLWAAYLTRVRHLQQQFAIGLEARVNERTRIARELHDTLLQSLHGVMFQFQAARNLLPRSTEAAMTALDGAILETEHAIADSRDAIHNLRTEPASHTDLAELLRAMGQELAEARKSDKPSPVFRLIVEGDRRPLSRFVQDEVYRIAHETLRNAFQHAQADRIEAEIRYDDQGLRLRVRDDGTGVDPKILEQGGRPGHWGLRGIQERAKDIGAELDFWSEAGAGTEVQLKVPATVAYDRSTRVDGRSHDGRESFQAGKTT